tara:strand:- start:54 stop:356 length:303 start_codon:yes stop_codon:yes gene_type:complete
MESKLKQFVSFLINGSEKLINNIIFSLTLGFIVALIVFNNTSHEFEYVKKYGIPTGENVIETYSHRKVYFYNYKPSISAFVISSGIFFLYYNRSRKSHKQ